MVTTTPVFIDEEILEDIDPDGTLYDYYLDMMFPAEDEEDDE